MIVRAPAPPLRPFIRVMWATEVGDLEPRPAARERVLPTGTASIAFLLGDPLRLFRDESDFEGFRVGRAVVGGPRDSFYVKDIARPSLSVGLQLQPGAASVVLGVPADAIAGRHTPLEDLWGPSATSLLEELAAARTPADRLVCLERALLVRLPRVRGVRPEIANALSILSDADVPSVREVVRESGFSHRHFIHLFREAVGLTPKSYARIVRFQRLVNALSADHRARTIEIALATGYGDQPHMTREFRALAGLSPARYRHVSPAWANHVPIVD